MSLTLYYHPLSSFCQKVLIALYENDTPFDAAARRSRRPRRARGVPRLWPIGKFPVLRDDARDRDLPEFEHHHRVSRAALIRAATRFIPADPDLARQTRLRDRFFDLYVHVPMQKIVGDQLRPADKNDPHGVEHARDAAGDRLRHDRAGDGRPDLGDGRRVHAWPTAPPRRRSSTPTRCCPSRDTHPNVARLSRAPDGSARPSRAR